jgi:hypothetical protein
MLSLIYAIQHPNRPRNALGISFPKRLRCANAMPNPKEIVATELLVKRL